MSELSMNIPDEKQAPMVAQMMGTFWMSTILSFVKHAGTDESMQVMGPMLVNIGISKAESMVKVLPPFEKMPWVSLNGPTVGRK